MTPERNLWQECLCLLVNDALHGAAGDNREADTELARRYLTTPSADLSMVCHMAGLDPDAVIDRMRRRLANITTTPKRRATRKARTYEHDGLALTINEWSSRTGLKRNTILSRLRLRLPMDQVLRPVAPRSLTYNGQTLTIDEWADHTGLKRNTILSRLNLGWPVARVLTEPVLTRRQRRDRGVGSNLSGIPETGGGTTGQDSPKITFLGTSK